MEIAIRSYKSLSNLLTTLNSIEADEEVKYVAMELCDNMLKAKTYGSISIDFDRKIIVNYIDKGSYSKWRELSMFLSIIRFSYTNRDLWFPYLQKDNSRGFLTMFFMGWELYAIKERDDKYSIIARKNDKGI